MTATFEITPRHTTPRPALRVRLTEWLLRREALARARAWPPLSGAARPLAERAREAANAAAYLLAATEFCSRAEPRASTSALTLYREAAYWALRALATDAAGVTPGEASRALPVDPADELTRAFAEAPPERLLEVAGSADALAAAQAALRARSFEQASTLSQPECEAELRHARSFVEALLRTLDARSALVPRLLGQRYGRLLALAVGLPLALVAVRAVALEAQRYTRADLAPNASWRVSSTKSDFAASGRGFHPPEGGPNVFFQTLIEDAPWIEFDLGAPRALRGVSVDNRIDCCQDHAVPLLVELSDDGQQWHEVARREQRFYYWTAWFPESKARYLRLRVDRRTLLHLGPIAIR